jgi:hypothetical protein
MYRVRLIAGNGSIPAQRPFERASPPLQTPACCLARPAPFGVRRVPKSSPTKSKARRVGDKPDPSRSPPTVARLTYRRDEAAAALGVSVQTVDAWIGSGLLRASKPPGVSGKPGRYLLIRAADIETMLTASAVTTAASIAA